MSLNMKINQQNFSTIQQLSEQYLNPKTAKKESNREGTLSFEEILKSKQEGTQPAGREKHQSVGESDAASLRRNGEGEGKRN